MEIRKIPVSEINPAEYNPRIDLKPEDPEYQKLKKSMANFGYVDPIIWNKQTGNLVGGHQRFKILIEQGLKEVEASVVDLSLKKEQALNLALNKIQGRWDDDKLAALIQELTTMPDFDIALTGFDAPEISNILDGLSGDDEDDFDVDGAIESIDEPVTKRGDIVELGRHRILCGDSANSEDIKRLMGDAKANLIFTDPPYLAKYTGDRPVKKRRNNKAMKMIQNDSMSQEDYELWLKQVLTNISSFISAGTPFYIWNGFRQFGPMGQMLVEIGFHLSNVITWMKPSICISYSDYNFQSEFCLYGWLKGDRPHKWYGSTKESNIWQISRDSSTSIIHQNQKPIELAQRAIKNSSIRNDIVLDTFLGSGSTLIAAESLGRRCFGVEIDPKYVDGIVHRYISFVGRDKVHDEVKKKYMKEVRHG